MTTNPPAQPTVVAGDWLNLASNDIVTIKGILIAATALIAIFAVARTYMRTQAIAPTLMVIIISAGVVYAVAHMDALANQTGTEITTPGANPSGASLPDTFAHHAASPAATEA